MRQNLQRAIKGTVLALAVASIAGPIPALAAPGWRALLKEIVDINSGTRNVDGLDAVRKVLIPAFEELGLKATVHDLEDGHKLVAMKVPGGKPELLLMGHIDTVFPKDAKSQDYRVEGDRIYGPGVIDMKAGIVLMVELLKTLRKTDLTKKVLVVINDDEEIGSPYSRDLVKKLTAGVPSGLVFEPGLPDGAVVTSQSGVRWLSLSVQGKASHAGLEPEEGINACVALSHKVVDISKLTDFSRKLTVNVGVIEGGTKPNVVCEAAKAGIDVRFVEEDDLEKTLRMIRAIAAKAYVYNAHLKAAPKASLKTSAALPSLPASRTRRLFGLLKIAGEKVGQKVTGRHVGYGSDANNLADTGLDLLVGLGPYGQGMHTDGEYLTISTFDARLALTAALVREIVR